MEIHTIDDPTGLFFLATNRKSTTRDPSLADIYAVKISELTKSNPENMKFVFLTTLALAVSTAAADLKFLRASRLLQAPALFEDDLPVPSHAILDQVTGEECLSSGGSVVGDIGNGAIFREDYVCESNGLPPTARIDQSGEDVIMTDGGVCCGPAVSLPRYGQLSQSGFCVQKVDDPSDPTSNKVKFLPCDDTNQAQMWKFSKTDPNPNFERGGLLTNKEGGCLAIRGDVTSGKNLKVLDCDRNNPKNHWLSTGDNVLPREYRKYCVAPEVQPVKPRTAVVLYDCEDTASLDN